MKLRYLSYPLVFVVVALLQIGLYQLGLERGQRLAKRDVHFTEKQRLSIIGIDLSQDDVYLHDRGDLNERVKKINCSGTIFVLGGKVTEPLDLSDCEGVFLSMLDFTPATKIRADGEYTLKFKDGGIGLK